MLDTGVLMFFANERHVKLREGKEQPRYAFSSALDKVR